MIQAIKWSNPNKNGDAPPYITTRRKKDTCCHFVNVIMKGSLYKRYFEQAENTCGWCANIG